MDIHPVNVRLSLFFLLNMWLLLSMKSLGTAIIKNKQRGLWLVKILWNSWKKVFHEFKRTFILYFSLRFSLLCSLLKGFFNFFWTWGTPQVPLMELTEFQTSEGSAQMTNKMGRSNRRRKRTIPSQDHRKLTGNETVSSQGTSAGAKR